jgi:cytochrome c-type biogenesis protein CcmH
MTRLLLLLLLLAAPALAVQPDERLADPALEARARALSRELRCVVCQNESIDDSNAPLARDIRLLLRERLAAGDSDSAAQQFLVARYGDFVLLRPPVRADTWLLWFGPIGLLLAGIAVAALALRRRATAPPPAPLTPEEQARLDALLREEERQ